MKIAIIGLGDTKEEAPIDDPEWIKYGLPWDDNWQKYDCLFEMHQPELLQLPLAGVWSEHWDGKRMVIDMHRPEDYLTRLHIIARDKKKILYAHERFIEGIKPFPFNKIHNLLPDYYVSSMSYMLALAIYTLAGEKKIDEREIGIWGVDICVDGEWVYQRANNEYFIGRAEGMGIKMTLPEDSMLKKFVPLPVKFGAIEIQYHRRYGLLGPEQQEFKRCESSTDR